jgi:hypothetical protein
MGVTPEASLATPALYDGFAHTDEERIVLTRICLARLGALVRAMLHSDSLRLQPYVTDEGYKSAIQQMAIGARTVVQDASNAYPDGMATVAAAQLSRLHNLFLAEFLDPEILAGMSVADVLKLRTRAWGKAGEHREVLGRTLREIGTQTANADEFEKQCRAALTEYRKARIDFDNEAAQLRIKLIADLGRLLLGMETGEVGAELAHKYIQFDSFQTLLIVGGMIFLRLASERGPELQALLHRKTERDDLLGCGLATPYLPFMSKRRRKPGP